jgi:hypothetical protein
VRFSNDELLETDSFFGGGEKKLSSQTEKKAKSNFRARASKRPETDTGTYFVIKKHHLLRA